jgi:non-specific protein-tyrosine kinase
MAVLVTMRTTPVYAATVTLMVSAPGDGSGTTSAYTALLLSQQRVKSYAQLLDSRRVAVAVAKSLGDGVSADDLRDRISAEAVPDTVLVRATVKDTSPARAQEVANALGRQFPSFIDGIERPAQAKDAGVRITVADDADLPTAPESPRPLLNLGLGLLIGLVAGAVAAVLRENSDTSLRSEDELSAATGGVALGAVGFYRDAARRPLLVRADGDSPGAEAFRTLRTSLQFATGDRPPRSVAVTSAVADEGKSTVACNLAITLAEAGWRVVLVDADLRRPRVADYFGIGADEGLTDVLRGAAVLDDVLRPWGSGSLAVLPGGPVPPNPSELLSSEQMSRLLDELSARADVVLVDTPALLPVTDAAVVAHRCAGTILVARYGRTRREQVSRVVGRLTAVDATLLGAVLNFVPDTEPERRAYGHEPRLGIRQAHLTGTP